MGLQIKRCGRLFNHLGIQSMLYIVRRLFLSEVDALELKPSEVGKNSLQSDSGHFYYLRP
ncbi:hypothetical protein ASC93_00870 [Massilia sp. Root335]|nr:hypothetical protein ASC93_00870 [Massilia sp. Root335]